MRELLVVSMRGDLDESVHRVSVVVADQAGRLLRVAGDPDQLVYWRSAAKPFQVWPLVAAGGVGRFGLDSAMLALACGSHNGEPVHRETTERWLRATGCSEEMLACGGHLSLSPKIAARTQRAGEHPTPLWSNCSGKHAALLALARLHGWETDGYEKLGHPVQDAVMDSVARWTGLDPARLRWGTDGCSAAAVATPLSAMAVAWARLGADPDPALATLRQAMMSYPEMVAGDDRIDTRLMRGWPGRLVVKIGADGVFGAAIPELGLGIAIKVADGDMRAAGLALVEVLRQVTATLGAGREWPEEPLSPWIGPPVTDMRGRRVGYLQVRGSLDPITPETELADA